MWHIDGLQLKILLAVTLTVSTLTLPEKTLAFLSEAQTVPPAAQTQSGDPVQVRRAEYHPGALIIKFRDEAIIGAVAGELVRTGQSFREVTGNDHLDRLNAKYKVKAMHRVFAPVPAGEPSGPIDRVTATQRHKEQRDKQLMHVAGIREKRHATKGLSKKNIPGEKTPPYLDSVYRLEVDPKTFIDGACRDYTSDPNIAYCQPDFKMEAQWIPNDPYYASFGSWGQGYDDLWGLRKLQIEAAWDVSKGEGVVVAVVDTGVDYNHIDLASNIWTNTGEIPGNGIDDDGNGFIDDVRGWDFVTNDNDPYDGHGHGTHVSGTIAAVGNNGEGIVGVAPAAKIMPLKGLDDGGSGSSYGLARAIRYAADNGADVINNSWGCSSACPSNPVAEDAVRYAHELGAVVVFAAGNSNGDVNQYSPGNQANEVITVASSSELDTKSDFSNFGSAIDVSAPGGGDDGTSSNRVGRNILSLRAGSTDLYADGLCTVGVGYYRARGTSMAAPHVSGVAALVVASHPSFTPGDVSQALRASADDIDTPGFDLSSGAGRVNAQRAVNITAVPRVRITSPLNYVFITNGARTVTIKGDAYGANFAKYRLSYAPVNSVDSQGQFSPVVGTWKTLVSESTQSVIDGVLAEASNSLFPLGWSYLLKLEVTTTDDKVFSDIKEIQFYKEDPRFNVLTTGEVNSTPCSEGDRFAWRETEPQGTNRYVGKVYDGVTNRMYTIYPEEGREGAWVDKIFLNANKIIWYETNYSYGKIGIASLNPAGDMIVETVFPNELFSAGQNKILMNQGENTIPTGQTVYLFDLTTNTLSPEYRLPPGDYSQFWPSVLGDSVVTNMWYPGGINDDVTVNLTDLPTGYNEVVRTVTGDSSVQGAINGPGVVVWTERLSLTDGDHLWCFDKTTKAIRFVDESHPYSFATDGKSILYTKFGTESGELKTNLYSYNIATGAKSFYATNHLKLAANNMWPSFGTKHIQWSATPLIMVSNEVPVLGSVGNQAVAINATFTLPITAADSEQDKVDLDAVGGIWPDATTSLPSGATFTDNGNGTGTLQWTPTQPGVYTVSFLARDFSGRKEETWNSMQSATFLAYDPSSPLKPLAVTIAGDGTVNSSQGAGLNCSSASCSQDYSDGTNIVLTATPGPGYAFSGWSGACSGIAPCALTMNQPRIVTATFAPSYLLEVKLSGSGTVHSSPAPDVNCSSSSCRQSYANVSVVTLTATPAPGFVFSGWSGDCSGMETCMVTMNQDQSITATFIPTYPLNVTVSGSGTVHSSPSTDISCSSGTCSKTYPSGSVVTLTASPSTDYLFTGWSGACGGTGDCTVTMDAATAVTASFINPNHRTLSVTVSGSGTVHSSPSPDINCSSGTCTVSYMVGSAVTLSVVPSAGFVFSGWTGDCSGTDTCTVPMDQAKSATAIFTKTSSLLSVSIILSRGTVHSSPLPDIDCTTGTCTQWYDLGTNATLTASPGPVSYFGGWTGACSGSGTNNACMVTMNQDQGVGAIFYGCGSMVSSSCFQYIQSALSNASSGSTIKARGGVIYQSLVTTQSVSLSLEGGYDVEFTNRADFTSIPQLTVMYGDLTVSDIIIK
ncbi:thermophilic serine proteinase [Geobacter sp. OR-1]|uniref:S8 family serine peptidase n=1 Tax=Geobacter sp. OR-1 TaxID=1266765 RepID=UPI000543C6B5|nr:S8 family serine peptidase [Geobacter sp. OR-1]GAM08162.1 thermophilic serine proteinase [Geobacter sp. OR-1]